MANKLRIEKCHLVIGSSSKVSSKSNFSRMVETEARCKFGSQVEVRK